ncbi:SDR family NAD(P)-dependent oxidoreductase [Ruania zhangjianzhongii]|uniref:SDR family NAD(P)-dependent oxidoreductase n=1 Tax=Ruania zhangjianzhongii TaxID=2603206 RepID=UPI0011CB4FC9|nr:SDR family oxidoreductase [Ruania zhangjianzhongii]
MTTSEQLFTGRTAVVTGGARGLGLAMASALARHGAQVALLDVLEDVAASARALSEETGAAAIGLHCDVTEEDSIGAALDGVETELGVATVLVNAAGIASPTPALDIGRAEWDRMLAVNITGTFLPAQQFARRAIAAGLEGAVVNVSSMSGEIVNVPQTQAAYNTSKAAVAMLTKSLAVEWLPAGIRVNAIAPGYFASDMTRDVAASDPQMAQEWHSRIPSGRMGEPDELGDLVVYLASDRSRYVVGQNVVIDGGYTLL